MKVGHFGLTREVPKKGESYTSDPGAELWRAPECHELFDGELHYGTPADIFSFGMQALRCCGVVLLCWSGMLWCGIHKPFIC